MITTTHSDQAFQHSFEQLTLDPHDFDHCGHLRIAWLYLTQFDKQTALNKTCYGIKTYAESLGAKDKYHHTITYALVEIMALRMDKSPECRNCFSRFLDENSDLVTNAIEVLKRYYSEAVLFSNTAQTTLVQPNRTNFA